LLLLNRSRCAHACLDSLDLRGRNLHPPREDDGPYLTGPDQVLKRGSRGDPEASRGLPLRKQTAFERGDRTPHVETLVRIAAALGVSLSQLFIEAHEPSANDLPLLAYLGTLRLSPDDVKAVLMVARAMFKGGPP